MKKALLRLYLKSIYEQLTNSRTEIKKNLKEDAIKGETTGQWGVSMHDDIPCMNDLENAIESIFNLICTLEH